jgi:integrase
MQKPRKLPSGNWNIQAYDRTENGKVKQVSRTFPTKREAIAWAAEYEDEREQSNVPAEMTVKDAVNKYLKLRSVLSPTTTSGYKHGLAEGFSGLLDLKVRSLTSTTVQEYINMETCRIGRNGRQISAKTVKNEWGTISAALRTVCGKSFVVRLPKVQQKQKNLSPAAKILEAIKGTDIELPCLLAMWRSLRISEVRGLKFSDLKDGILTVNRVIVDVDNSAVMKETTKTDSSRRSFPVPAYIMQLIESNPRYMEYKAGGEDGPLVEMSRAQIYGRWQTICSHCGIDMTFHDLRSMNASILLNVLNVPEKLVQRQGGWETDHVMKRVYSVAFDDAMMGMFKQMDDYMASQMNIQNPKKNALRRPLKKRTRGE